VKKRIVLCADDYGQGLSISKGILALLEAGRLSAVSCLVTSSHWQKHAVWLKPFASQVAIGLHFNLTEGRASLRTVLLQGLLGRLEETEMQRLWHEQINAFEAEMGFLPHFIDGHQHVHQLKGVREALCVVYQERLRVAMPYVRVVNGVMRSFKKAFIYATGSRALEQLLDQHKITHNDSFSGIYAFHTAHRYYQHFPRFLEEIGDRGIIMCHPGYPADDDSDDPIASARHLEYQYLVGPDFEAVCHAQQVVFDRVIPPSMACCIT
jgi:predicted glycoside hydrolase/deacetylase ChbG (UPF0249 family)